MSFLLRELFLSGKTCSCNNINQKLIILNTKNIIFCAPLIRHCPILCPTYQALSHFVPHLSGTVPFCAPLIRHCPILRDPLCQSAHERCIGRPRFGNVANDCVSTSKSAVPTSSVLQHQSAQHNVSFKDSALPNKVIF
jgi:hypothetical protein